jgi:hypothetical protein
MVVVVAELVILDQPVQLVPVMVRRVHKGRLDCLVQQVILVRLD